MEGAVGGLQIGLGITMLEEDLAIWDAALSAFPFPMKCLTLEEDEQNEES